VVTGTADESALIVALRAGDHSAFALLVDEHTPAMMRVARGYMSDDVIAEEVVQATWLALVKGVSKFEGRSSLRTWLFVVMTNIAKARGIHERRHTDAAVAFVEATVDSTRFHGAGEPDAGSWKEPPAAFPDDPERSVLNQKLHSIAQRELDRLPDGQRLVVTLRDMLGFDSAEVCEVLGITAGNQQIMLHRGRAAIRQVLEEHVREDSSVPTDS
jgi:RNA polymerase sigma-70 factor (ECF subfamily)